jgi:hypothetical protein
LIEVRRGFTTKPEHEEGETVEINGKTYYRIGGTARKK